MKTSNPEITDLAITGLDVTDMQGSDVDTTDIEVLLSAAGIDFTVVERCPHPDCRICADRLSAAA